MGFLSKLKDKNKELCIILNGFIWTFLHQNESYEEFKLRSKVVKNDDYDGFIPVA